MLLLLLLLLDHPVLVALVAEAGLVELIIGGLGAGQVGGRLGAGWCWEGGHPGLVAVGSCWVGLRSGLVDLLRCWEAEGWSMLLAAWIHGDWQTSVEGSWLLWNPCCHNGYPGC